MPFYNLERISDLATYETVAGTDEEALAFFSREAGETLGFNGNGSPSYMFQRRFTSLGWVKPDIPVYAIGKETTRL